MGNWDKTKYAVLIPLEDIENEQIGGALSVDLFTKGGINLTKKAWILCPKGEGDFIKQENPNVNVIEYEGEYVTGYAQAFVSTLGYHAEIAGGRNWLDINTEKAFYNVLKAEKGIEGIATLHTDTSFGRAEDDIDMINLIVSVYDKINKEGFINSTEDINEILSANENLKYAFNNLDIFFEKMQSIGLEIPKPYQKILKSKEKIKEMVKEKKKNELVSLFETDEKVTEEEKITLTNLMEKLAGNRFSIDEASIEKLFVRFLNISAISNVDSIHKLKENNFENMENNLLNYIDELQFKEKNQIFRDERRYSSSVRDACLSVQEDNITHKHTITLSREKMPVPQVYIKYQRPYHSNIPLSSIEGKIQFRCVDENGSTYEIEYNENNVEPIIKKDAKTLELKEGQTIFDYISNPEYEYVFKTYYDLIRYYQTNKILKENLSFEENKREKRQEISTRNIGKRTINAETINKKTVDENFEEWEKYEKNYNITSR